MIQKIQTLQKRLISKTEEVVERDLLIQEKEKLYVELKNILARQPGPEVAEQLSTYQANMREKNKQMKSMASELNVYQAQVCGSLCLVRISSASTRCLTQAAVLIRVKHWVLVSRVFLTIQVCDSPLLVYWWYLVMWCRRTSTSMKLSV